MKGTHQPGVFSLVPEKPQHIAEERVREPQQRLW
jgi:hypothetical protein